MYRFILNVVVLAQHDSNVVVYTQVCWLFWVFFIPLFGLVQTRPWFWSSIWISSVAGILWVQGRQTPSDKLRDLTSTTTMFSNIAAKTSPRLPSQFKSMYKILCQIYIVQPDFRVPYLTLKEHLHIRQQSLDHPPLKSPRVTRCHVCLHFASLLLDSYLIHVKCRHDTSRGEEFKNR